jgi:hypothetical protein
MMRRGQWPPAAVNEVGIRQLPEKGRGKHRRTTDMLHSRPAFDPVGGRNAERQAILAWERQVAGVSCCVYAYMMETVSGSATIARQAGKPYRCPNLCVAWRAFQEAEFPLP